MHPLYEQMATSVFERMFGSLIRRKQTQRPLGEDDIAFESTTFSLSTAVPRPSERDASRRTTSRHSSRFKSSDMLRRERRRGSLGTAIIPARSIRITSAP